MPFASTTIQTRRRACSIDVRTACFLCNAVKGDAGGGEQFALAL